MKRLFPDPADLSLGTIWCIFFAFTTSVALFAQLWFLPTFLPGGTSEYGLLRGTDSISYHQLAVAMAERINENGWTEWALYPNGWFMVGFVGAIYAITVPEPWVIIPLNAAAHAISGIALIKIALCFTSNRRAVFLAALPYILFPSASFWYTQMLKDGFFNMGILVFLAGWIYLIRAQSWQSLFSAVLAILFGFIVFSTVRLYMLSIANPATFFIVLFALSTGVAGLIHEPAKRVILSLRLGVIIAVFGLQLTYPSLIVHTSAVSESNISLDSRTSYLKNNWAGWSGTIPGIISQKLHTLAGTRQAYILGRSDALSTLDRDVIYESPGDIFSYVPRAMQIIFFAPFPDMWLGAGSTPATTIMRRVSMIEMLVSYTLMLGLPIAMWNWRRRPEMWAAVAFCSSIMLVYGLSSPNVGTIYRVRYEYFMVFLSFGVLGWHRLRQKE